MSLKAKLEAVIYAAEEPVTLAQLALLFTADALRWKAEHDAGLQPETAAPGSELLPLAQSASSNFEAEANAAEAVPPSDPDGMQNPEQVGATVSDVADNAAAQPSAEAPVTPDAESELKREARQRDRDVRNVLRSLLDELIAGYADDDRGVEIREVAGGYRMATKPECHDAVRGFVKTLKPPLRLSLPALETLAVIAYKQPVTAPEVNEIRGVDSSGVFGSLLSRKLIATAGRKPVVGRPILYKTTREFLLRFGLKDVSELPSMEEFEKLAASELEELETQLDGEADDEPGVRQLPELDETASEEPEDSPQASNSSEPAAQALAPGASPANSSAGLSDPAESEQVSR